MKTKEELINEAIAKGIVPGAVVRSPYGKKWVAGPTDRWDVDSGGGLHDSGAQIYSTVYGIWATVITAHEDQQQGLVDGMACEPDEHMRRAIVEKAKELGMPEAYTPDCHYPALVWFKQMEDCRKRDDCSTVRRHWITPGEFYDRLCNTVKPEPPIRIGGHYVGFGKGEIVVGCTSIPNDIVRKIAEKLKD